MLALPVRGGFNNALYAAWKGIEGDQGIYRFRFDGTSWAPQKNIGTSPQ